jgi:hypothetical protein
VALASGVFALSSLVVFATPQTAEALAPVPVAIEIGETLAGPLVEAGGEATCAASIVCGVAVLAVTAAYLTRDSWLPVVQGALGAAVNGSQPGPAAACGNAVSGSLGADGNSLTANATWTVCGNGSGTWKAHVDVRAVECKDTSTGIVRRSSGIPSNIGGGDHESDWLPSPGHFDTTFPNLGCDAGERASFVEFDSSYWYYGTPYTSKPFDIGDAVGADSYVEKSDMQCRLPDGTIKVAHAEASGDLGKIIVPSCSAAFPGSIPVDLTVTGGTDMHQLPVLHKAFLDIHDRFPDCFDSAGAWKNTCRVRVFVNGQPCVNGMAGCYDPAGYLQDHPDATVDCKYGTYVVDLADCAPLKHHYGTKPSTQTVTVTQVDTKSGTPITDPTVKPSPSTGTGTSPSTGGFPDVVTNPSTAPGGDPSSDPDSSNCYGAAVSWNPVNWVYVPVKCALSWAFVPKSAPSFSDVGSPLPAGWLPSLNGITDSSCGPLTMPKLELGYKNWSVGPVQMLSTCDDPWPLVRTFTYYGLEATVLVTVMWQSFRAVTSGVGMGVNFSGGGDDE